MMMDKKLFYLLLFTAATGLCTGCFFEVNMTGEGKDQLMDLLDGFFSTGGSGMSLSASFWQNFRSGFLFLLLCYLSPVVVILLPLDVLFLFCRSLFLGFSAAMLLETFGPSGIGYVLLTLAPSGLIQVLLFAFLCTVSMQEGAETLRALRQMVFHTRAGSRRSSRTAQKNRNALQLITGQYLNVYLGGLAVLTLSCLLQACLLQAVT